MTNKEHRLLQIGVVGCGPIAQFAHLEACRKARNAELSAVCDVAADLVERVAAIHQPKATYLDYDALLADPQVEAVIVAVADQFHVPLAQRAIAASRACTERWSTPCGRSPPPPSLGVVGGD